jgi:hypothetical protein
MNHPGWLLVIVGAVIAGMGLIWVLIPSLPWLGRLPGDIRIEGQNTRIYFPVATCILLSVLLTAVLWLSRYFSRP